jgi:hypothetical protein
MILVANQFSVQRHDLESYWYKIQAGHHLENMLTFWSPHREVRKLTFSFPNRNSQRFGRDKKETLGLFFWLWSLLFECRKIMSLIFSVGRGRSGFAHARQCNGRVNFAPLGRQLRLSWQCRLLWGLYGQWGLSRWNWRQKRKSEWWRRKVASPLPRKNA